MLQVGDGADQARDLIETEHHRRGLRDAHRTGLGQQLPAPLRDAEEELQSRERCVERDRRGALVDQMQLEQPEVLGRGGIRPARKKLGSLRTARR
jgi:hypothetical protein